MSKNKDLNPCYMVDVVQNVKYLFFSRKRDARLIIKHFRFRPIYYGQETFHPDASFEEKPAWMMSS